VGFANLISLNLTNLWHLFICCIFVLCLELIC